MFTQQTATISACRTFTKYYPENSSNKKKQNPPLNENLLDLEDKAKLTQANNLIIVVDGNYCNTPRLWGEILEGRRLMHEAVTQAGMRLSTRVLVNTGTQQFNSTGWMDTPCLNAMAVASPGGIVPAVDLVSVLDIAGQDAKLPRKMSGIILVAPEIAPFDVTSCSQDAMCLTKEGQRLFVVLPKGTSEPQCRRLQKAATKLGGMTHACKSPSETMAVFGLAATGNLVALAEYAETLKSGDGIRACKSCVRNMSFPMSVTQIMNKVNPKSMY